MFRICYPLVPSFTCTLFHAPFSTQKKITSFICRYFIHGENSKGGYNKERTSRTRFCSNVFTQNHGGTFCKNISSTQIQKQFEHPSSSSSPLLLAAAMNWKSKNAVHKVMYNLVEKSFTASFTLIIARKIVQLELTWLTRICLLHSTHFDRKKDVAFCFLEMGLCINRQASSSFYRNLSPLKLLPLTSSSTDSLWLYWLNSTKKNCDRSGQ